MLMVLAFSLLFKRPRAETREKIGIEKRVQRDETKKRKEIMSKNDYGPCALAIFDDSGACEKHEMLENYCV